MTRSVEVGKADAFPATAEHLIGSGLTKREYIATMALQGIVAIAHNDQTFDAAARDAVVYADALLAELAK